MKKESFQRDSPTQTEIQTGLGEGECCTFQVAASYSTEERVSKEPGWLKPAMDVFLPDT